MPKEGRDLLETQKIKRLHHENEDLWALLYREREKATELEDQILCLEDQIRELEWQIQTSAI